MGLRPSPNPHRRWRRPDTSDVVTVMGDLEFDRMLRRLALEGPSLDEDQATYLDDRPVETAIAERLRDKR